MDSAREADHFVTLFDSKFLPMGICLYESLLRYAQPFHLWIICIDELVEHQLGSIGLRHVTLIPLREVETEALLAVKQERSRAEYCWTLTPFAPQFVFDRSEAVSRVTYLDADLFFFDDPKILLGELDECGKSVLITDHAYAPEYDQSGLYGRFCVQFMTFCRTPGGLRVLHWWQDKCIEWCYARVEEGRFGDQKYLDVWPDIFSDDVHVLQRVEQTLAPWNVRYLGKCHGELAPVFFHFHSLRIVDSREMILYRGYNIGSSGESFYDQYVDALLDCFERLKLLGIVIPVIPNNESIPQIRRLKRWITRTGRYYRICA